MNLTVFAGSANVPLTAGIAERLGVALGRRVVQGFPDGELHIEIEESVRGHDVYLVQPTSPPVDQHLLELCLLADACRRAGAARLTAIVPYFGYARQDRRASGREPVAARLVADLLKTSGLQRVVALDLHSPALEGFFAVPVEHLSAVALLAEAALPHVPDNAVIVAPDLGAVKLAERYAKVIPRPVAIAHKIRLTGEEVAVQGIVGDVWGRAAVVVDDMISTGGTIAAAIKSLRAAGCAPDISVVTSHGLFVGPAVERLRALDVRRFIVTDSVALPPGLPLPLQVVSVGPVLADAVARLHADQSLGDLIAHR